MERIGPYEVLGLLARGGMGVVLRARDLRDGRQVALKVPSEDLWSSEARRTRFLREAEALARLDHPHVVRVLESGLADGRPFIAMELIEGPSLAVYLAGRSGPLSPGEAAELVRKLARGVEHAHQQGVLHRDIKPGNVLLSSAGEPLLTDFGLARALEGSDLTRTGQLLGTPGFAAPELVRGELGEVGPATDVYGLGATLYALLTGLPPARGDTIGEVLEATTDRPPPPPGRLRPGIDPGLERLCLACLAKEPARRPASAAALADELERWLRGEPAAGRRSRAPLLAGAILLAGGGAALGLGLTRSPGPRDPGAPPAVETPAVETPAVSAEALTREGIRRHEAGDPGGAIEVLTRALDLAPSANAAFARGNAHEDLGRLEEASADYARALSLDPRHTGALMNRGLVRSRQRDTAGALADWAQALAIDPGLASVHLNRANLRLAGGDAPGALEDLDAALAIDPRFCLARVTRGSLLVRQGDAARGLRDLGQAVELAAGPPLGNRWGASVTQAELLYQARLARGRALKDQGEHRAALEDAEQLVALRPDDPEAWNLRGTLRDKLGDARGAVADLTRAIELGPREAAYLINRGNARTDAALAEADHTAAIACAAPGSVTLGLAHYNRGNVRVDRGDTTGALEDLERAVALLANDVRPLRSRGNLRRRLGDLAGALADHSRAIELDPRSHVAWGLRALDHAALEDWPRALEDVEQALRRAPGHAESLHLRGRVRLRLGRADGAIEDLTRALERLPAGSAQAKEAAALLEEARAARPR